MGILYSLLLIVLGLLAAQEYIVSKLPASRKLIDALDGYAEYAGIAGLVLGIHWLIEGVGLVGHPGISPLIILKIWGSALVTLALGLIFGLSLIRRFLNDNAATFLAKADELRTSLLPYRKELGLASLALGVIFLF